MLTCIYPHDHDGTAVGILFCTSARIIIIRTNNVPMCVLKFDGVDENPKPPKNVIALSAISPIISVNRLTLTHNTQRSSLFLGRGCGGVEVAEADVCMYVCTHAHKLINNVHSIMTDVVKSIFFPLHLSNIPHTIHIIPTISIYSSFMVFEYMFV